MPRPPAIIPTEYLHVRIPAPLRHRVELLLYSEAERRVPHGAYGKMFTQLLTDFFENKPLDISRFLDAPAGTHMIVAPVQTLTKLLFLLEETARLKAEATTILKDTSA